MKFDISDLITKEENEESLDKLTAFVNIQDANGDNKYEASDVRKAYNTANFYVALINSGTLDYKVTYL